MITQSIHPSQFAYDRRAQPDDRKQGGSRKGDNGMDSSHVIYTPISTIRPGIIVPTYNLTCLVVISAISFRTVWLGKGHRPLKRLAGTNSPGVLSLGPDAVPAVAALPGSIPLLENHTSLRKAPTCPRNRSTSSPIRIRSLTTAFENRISKSPRA